MNERNRYSNSEEEWIRQMIRSTKVQASKNLKYRILQQVETEKALTTKKASAPKEQRNVLKDFGTLFGIMYAVLACMIAGAFLLKGKDYLLSPEFLWIVVLVTCVFSLFWLITRLDTYVEDKRRNRKQDIRRVPEEK